MLLLITQPYHVVVLLFGALESTHVSPYFVGEAVGGFEGTNEGGTVGDVEGIIE